MALRFAGSIVFALFLLQCSHNGAKADTTSSPLFPHGTQHGDENIDISAPKQIIPGFVIHFLGLNYDSLFISPDGTLAFGEDAEVSFEESITNLGGIRSPESDAPFIAPLLYKAYRPLNIAPSDYQGTISYRIVSSKSMDLSKDLNQYLPSTVVHAPEISEVITLIIITWENVAEGLETQSGRRCRKSQPCNSTTFQLVLAMDKKYLFAIFNYGKYTISAQDNYKAGINAGKGRGWYNVLPCHGPQPCSLVNQADAISNLANIQGSDLYGRFIFSVGQKEVIRAGCLSPELTHGILEVYPRSVGMFGGEKLEFSGICSGPNTVLYCRFGTAADQSSKITKATIVNSMKGYCPVPPLTTTGHLDLYVIDEKMEGTAYCRINIDGASEAPNFTIPVVTFQPFYTGIFVSPDDTDEAPNLPLIIGATVGGVVVLIIIVVVVVVVIKKRKSGSSSPVYEINKEPVRMSEVQGSNV